MREGYESGGGGEGVPAGGSWGEAVPAAHGQYRTLRRYTTTAVDPHMTSAQYYLVWSVDR